MNFNDRVEIEMNNFKGFTTVRELWNDKTCIPKSKEYAPLITPTFKKTEFIPYTNRKSKIANKIVVLKGGKRYFFYSYSG